MSRRDATKYHPQGFAGYDYLGSDSNCRRRCESIQIFSSSLLQPVNQIARAPTFPALKSFPTSSSLSIILPTQHPREADTHLQLVRYPSALHVPPYPYPPRRPSQRHPRSQTPAGPWPRAPSSATSRLPGRTHPRALAELLEVLAIVVVELRVLGQTGPRRQKGVDFADDPPQTSMPGRRHENK